MADAPNIDYFQDLDGDGVAEKKTTVLTGFSVSNVQGLLTHFDGGLIIAFTLRAAALADQFIVPGKKTKRLMSADGIFRLIPKPSISN